MAPNLYKEELGTQVLWELDDAKEELSRLRIAVESTLQARENAEKEIEASNAKARSYLSYLEEIRKEIEEANEDQVLIELARIEAERECREIEAKREVEFARFAKKMERERRKIKDIYKEISYTKELEAKLVIITSDVNVLQKEMDFIREMERSFNKNHLVEDSNKRREEKSAEAELKAAMTELECIKEEGYQLMAKMDFVREGLMDVAKEKERLKKLEMEADTSVQYLNSKFLKSKSKLESASMAEEKARVIVSNLSVTLQQLQIDIDAAKKEKELIDEKIDTIKIEIGKKISKSKSTEETLRATFQELEAIKASETIAIEKFKRITERTMQARALSLGSSTITISRFEYEYLVKGAEAAQEVAVKKVAAAQAWIKALEVEEKELLTKSEIVGGEIRELILGEEKELSKPEKASVTTEITRRSVSLSSIPGEHKKVMRRRSSILPGRRQSNSQFPPFSVRRKRKVVHNLVKFLRFEGLERKSE